MHKMIQTQILLVGLALASFAQANNWSCSAGCVASDNFHEWASDFSTVVSDGATATEGFHRLLISCGKGSRLLGSPELSVASLPSTCVREPGAKATGKGKHWSCATACAKSVDGDLSYVLSQGDTAAEAFHLLLSKCGAGSHLIAPPRLSIATVVNSCVEEP